MHELIGLSIEAHGGLARWHALRQLSATFQPGGVGLKQRGQEAFTRQPTRVTVDTREQSARFAPFLVPGQRAVFTTALTTIEAFDGTRLQTLSNPRESFAALAPGAAWSAPQLAYFVGYAMWMYLTLPFSLLRDGIGVIESDPHREDGETWRSLEVTFPTSMANHCPTQKLYFDTTGLLRRHDYTVEISHGARVAHYLYDHRPFDGIVFPTRRRVYPLDPHGQPDKQLVVISADLTEFELTSAIAR